MNIATCDEVAWIGEEEEERCLQDGVVAHVGELKAKFIMNHGLTDW